MPCTQSLLARLLMLATFAAALLSPTPNIREKQRAQAAKERQQELLRRRQAAPQRERKVECVADGQCLFKGLQVSIAEGAGLQFCKDCPNPDLEGAYMDTWEAARHPPAYHVDAELIWAVPNDASSTLMNAVGGAAVLAKRGGVSFAIKAKHAQEAGAVALVIMDDGSCTEDFVCGGWLGSKADGLLAWRDERQAWIDIQIPVVFVTANHGARLVRQMETRAMNMPGFGPQQHTI